MLKMAVKTPSPRAMVNTTEMVKAGALRSALAPKRMSRERASSVGQPDWSRYASFVCSRPPNSRRAA